MTEEQRRAQDIAAKDTRIAELTKELTTIKQTSLIQQQDQIVTAAAAKYVKPELTKHVTRELAAHLEELAKNDPAALKKFTPQKLETWMKKYVEDNPVFALPPPTDPAAAATQPATPVTPVTPPRQRTITTATPPPKAKPSPTSGAGSTEKTPIPGRPNSMNAKELNEYYKSKGVRKPY
jgi:hypothetical protein